MNNIVPDEDAPEGDKEGKISRRLAHAIDLMLSGKCTTQASAANESGLTREHLNRQLRKAHVRAFIARRTSENFVGLVPLAAATLARIMSGPNAVAALNASLTVLKQFGVVAQDGGPSVSVNVESPGYVIYLGEARRERLGAIDGAAPQLIDVTPVSSDGDAEGGDE